MEYLQVIKKSNEKKILILLTKITRIQGRRSQKIDILLSTSNKFFFHSFWNKNMNFNLFEDSVYILNIGTDAST